MSLSPWPHYASDEIDAVSAVLASGKVNYWTGEHGRRFEDQFAGYCGTRYAIALANGTDYGLEAYVVGADEDAAMEAGRRIDAGGVKVNGVRVTERRMPVYPDEIERKIKLRDGSPAFLRPIRLSTGARRA